jgi:hypothetical protein
VRLHAYERHVRLNAYERHVQKPGLMIFARIRV